MVMFQYFFFQFFSGGGWGVGGGGLFVLHSLLAVAGCILPQLTHYLLRECRVEVMYFEQRYSYQLLFAVILYTCTYMEPL